MSQLNVDTIKKADGTGNLSVPAETGTVVTTASPSLGRRNLIINGAMQVAQRGTSAVNHGGGYNTLDRWRTSQSSSGFGGATGLDQYQSTDAPDGFANSLKFVKNGATSINASVAAYLEYKIEGQDVQHLKYGTASAQSVTLSFWVKNSITGTYGLTLLEAGNARYNTQTYTVDTANTWEYKTVTFVGDTAASLANDNTEELNILFVLGAGTNWQTATTNTWSANADIATSSQVQWPETDDAEFYITGVQLEVGSVATPFEHRSYGEELALCQRYYTKSYGQGTNPATSTFYGAVGRHGVAGTATTAEMFTSTVFKVEMRTAPTVLAYDTSGNSGKCNATNFGVTENVNETCNEVHITTSGCHFQRPSGSAGCAITVHYTADAEL